MRKNTRAILFSLLALLCAFALPVVKAASHADTQTYYNTGRTGGVYAKDSDKVIKNGTIPNGYTFTLGAKYDSWAVNGRVAPTTSDMSLDIGELERSKDSTSKAVDSIKGKFSMTYKNAGIYNGKKIDVKLTVMDFAVSNGNGYTNEPAFIGFMHNDASVKRFGPWVYRIDWVEIKYEFLESGTEKPVDLKGYTSYWDVDLYQGIHLLDNNKGVYVTDKSTVKYVEINGVPYLYDEVNDDYDRGSARAYNEIGMITEIFAGSNMTRVFTFSRPISDKSDMAIKYAHGGIQHEAVVNGGLKSYASDTPAGADHAAVKVGDTIKYDIQFTNGDTTRDANVTITDVISKGLEYVTGSAKIGETAKEPDSKTVNSDGTTTLVWNTTAAKGTTNNLTYSVKVVSGYEKNQVNNNATIKIGDREYKVSLVNPLPSKDYASDTPNGAGGSEVEKNNVIKYSIKYSNPLKEKQKVEITDVISKGISYKKGTSSVNGTKIGDPKVTKNSDGGYTLVWEKEIDAEAVEELTYSVDVNGGVPQVKNNASMRYARMTSEGKYGEYGDKIQLNELINPLKENPGQVIIVPDTASIITITGIVLGTALIGGGSYLIYKRYKKA